jgi:hypothetical protein
LLDPTQHKVEKNNINRRNNEIINLPVRAFLGTAGRSTDILSSGICQKCKEK